MARIDERSTVPLYAMAIALPVLFAAAMAIATLSAKVDRAEARTLENETKIEKQNSLLTEIRDNLIEIKTTLKLNKKEN